MPFFNAWEFAGKFPDILTDPVVGEAASNLYADARRMLKTLIAERWVTARGVLGLFPANSVDDDDVEVYADDSRTQRHCAPASSCASRKARRRVSSHDCLADFVAPKIDAAWPDYIGAFAVTAGIGIEPARRALRGGARRLQRHPAQGAGRSARRSFR